MEPGLRDEISPKREGQRVGPPSGLFPNLERPIAFRQLPQSW